MITTLSSKAMPLSGKGHVPPRVIGHRGACGHAPENTFASFRKAAALGAGWVEFDTRLTGDGEVIIFHDETLDRTTSGQGDVSAAPLRHIQALDAGRWYHEDFRGEPVPTFRDTIGLLAELGLDANVEIKPSPGYEINTATATCGIIRDMWPAVLSPPIISSFEDSCLAVARDRLPHIERALLIKDDLPNWKFRAETLDCRALHVWHPLLTRDIVRDFRQSGYAVRAFTVNEVERAEQLVRWGVESICTDYPDRMAVL